MNEKRAKIIIFLLAAIAVVAGFIIRFYYLNTLSLRLDEAQSLLAANHGFRGPDNLFIFMASDVHPPLYASMLRATIHFFGDGVMALRFPSLVLGVLTIPLCYFLGKEVFGKREGLLFTFMAAFNPIWIWYSAEVKNYELFIFVSVLSLLYFFRIIHGKMKWYDIAIFLFAQTLGMYSHYFFFFLIAIEGLGGFLYKKKSVFVITTLAFLFFTPWIYTFLKYHQASTQPNLGGVNLFNIVLIFYELFLGYHSSNFYKYSIALWPMVILLSFIYIRAFKKFNKDMFLIVFGILFPIVAVFVISQQVVSIFLTRYLIFVSVFLFLLIAKIAVSSRTKMFRGITVILLFIVLISSTYNQMTDANNINNEDYRDAVAYVSAHAQQHDLIVISAAFTIYPFDYYYKGNNDFVTLPKWDKKKPINFTPTAIQMQQLVDEAKGSYYDIYLIESYDQSHTNDTVNWFNNHLKKLDSQYFGYNVEIHEYKIRYTPLPTDTVTQKTNSNLPTLSNSK